MLHWFPKSVSTYGGDVDSVFYLILFIGGFWFLLTEAIIIYSIIHYRRREGRRASFIQGEKRAELKWILIPTVIILILDLGIDLAGGKVWDKIKTEVPAGDVRVQVTGKQFNWVITYPGPDGTFGTADDLTEMNELNVPVGKTVRVTLTSEDVIHSFFVPVLRLKQDALPGREIPVWFEVTEPGRYEIACAELCGFGHYTMRGFLIVHTSGEYENWVKEHWPS